MLASAGIAIFMFGNKKKDGAVINADGSWEEYEIAKSLGKIILPLGSTGYVAKEILGNVRKNIIYFSYLSDYVSDLESIVDPNDLVNLVVKIVDSLKKF